MYPGALKEEGVSVHALSRSKSVKGKRKTNENIDNFLVIY